MAQDNKGYDDETVAMLRELLARRGIEPPYTEREIAVGFAVFNAVIDEKNATPGRPAKNPDAPDIHKWESWMIAYWFYRTNAEGLRGEGVPEDAGEEFWWAPPEQNWNLAYRQASLYLEDKLNVKRTARTIETYSHEIMKPARHGEGPSAEGMKAIDEFSNWIGLKPIRAGGSAIKHNEEMLKLLGIEPPTADVLMDKRYTNLRLARGPKPL